MMARRLEAIPSSLMTRTRWVAIVGISLILAGGVAGMLFKEVSAARTGVPLPVYGRVPPFQLVDHHGRPISQEDLRGQAWIAGFIFTRCAGQCPMMSAAMAQLARQFRNHGSVRVVSFTVDPEWDTPKVLSDYASRYAGPSDPWLFVTGDKDRLARLCQEGFRLAAAESTENLQEPITHSVRLVLVDQQGTIRGYYDATDPAALTRLRTAMQNLLNNPS